MGEKGRDCHVSGCSIQSFTIQNVQDARGQHVCQDPLNVHGPVQNLGDPHPSLLNLERFAMLTAAMGARPIVNDALWRCLCPSFLPVRQAHHSLRTRQTPTALGNLCARSRRSVSGAPPANKYSSTVVASNEAFFRPNERLGSPLRPQSKREKPDFVLLPTPELYDRLRTEAAAGRHDHVLDIIRILIKDREERLNSRIYTALLQSYVSPDRGTAGKVRKVLEEMAEVGIVLDSAACHAVLEVDDILYFSLRADANSALGPRRAPRLSVAQRNTCIYAGPLVHSF
jgi:hypothetical protein